MSWFSKKNWFRRKKLNNKITWDELKEFSIPKINSDLSLDTHILAAQVAEHRGWRFDYCGNIYEKQDKGGPVLVANNIQELASFGEKNNWFGNISHNEHSFIDWRSIDKSLTAVNYPLS